MDVIQHAIEGIGMLLAKLLHKERGSGHQIIIDKVAAEDETSLIVGAMAASGDINGAESYLFAELERRFDLGLYAFGLDFFAGLNGMTDERLRACNYSREEIAQGLADLQRLLEKFAQSDGNY